MIPTRRESPTYPPFEELSKLIYGEPGSGKTQFAAGDPHAFFISTEPGHDFVQTGVTRVYRWAPDESGQDKRPDFQTVVRQLWAAKRAGQLPYRTAVIDIVDNLYSMCLTAVCAKKGLSYPPENDFGKTWKEVREQWEMWIKSLMDVVNVTFITHCVADTIEFRDETGVSAEIKRQVPTFKGNRAAQVLDGVLNLMGYMYKSPDGAFSITFRSDPKLGTKDRTDVFEKIGPIKIPRNGGFALVADIYEKKAKEMGYQIKSKWEAL